jgi:hypothetical protein
MDCISDGRDALASIVTREEVHSELGKLYKPFMLYKSVPHAVLRDPALYELLALVDAIRDGRARERNLAERDLVHRLKSIHGQP